jgi:hypothetical protein
MFNQNAFLMSFLLANQQRDDLVQRGGTVPNDFVVRTAIVGGITQNAGLAALVMQNEVSGLEPKRDADLQVENKALQEEVAKLKAQLAEQGNSVTKTWNNFQDRFCKAVPGAIFLDKEDNVNIKLPNDESFKTLKALFTTNPNEAMMVFVKAHFDASLHPLLIPENCSGLTLGVSSTTLKK